MFEDRELLSQTLLTAITDNPTEITGGVAVLGFVEDGELKSGDPIPPNPEQ